MADGMIGRLLETGKVIVLTTYDVVVEPAVRKVKRGWDLGKASQNRTGHW